MLMSETIFGKACLLYKGAQGCKQNRGNTQEKKNPFHGRRALAGQRMHMELLKSRI